MTESICGLDCSECGLRDACRGCAATRGRPFGGACVIAACCQSKEHAHCDKCSDLPCELKKKLIAEIKALGIEDMEELADLNALKGSVVNLEYKLPGGQTVKFWEDERIYLGNQIRKRNSSRCYGIAASETHLLVCEYDEDGADVELIVFKRWR